MTQSLAGLGTQSCSRRQRTAVKGDRKSAKGKHTCGQVQRKPTHASRICSRWSLPRHLSPSHIAVAMWGVGSQKAPQTRFSLGLVTWALSPVCPKLLTLKESGFQQKSHCVYKQSHCVHKQAPGTVLLHYRWELNRNSSFQMSADSPPHKRAFPGTAAPRLLHSRLSSSHVYIKPILFPNSGTFHPPNTSPLNGRFPHPNLMWRTSLEIPR